MILAPNASEANDPTRKYAAEYPTWVLRVALSTFVAFLLTPFRGRFGDGTQSDEITYVADQEALIGNEAKLLL